MSLSPGSFHDKFKLKYDLSPEKISLPVQFGENNGKCGVCGDDIRQDEPRDHESNGVYGNGIIGRRYAVGQVGSGSNPGSILALSDLILLTENVPVLLTFYLKLLKIIT